MLNSPSLLKFTGSDMLIFSVLLMASIMSSATVVEFVLSAPITVSVRAIFSLLKDKEWYTITYNHCYYLWASPWRGIMVIILPSSTGRSWFHSRSDKIQDNNIGIFWFTAKCAALRDKSRFSRNNLFIGTKSG